MSRQSLCLARSGPGLNLLYQSSIAGRLWWLLICSGNPSLESQLRLDDLSPLTAGKWNWGQQAVGKPSTVRFFFLIWRHRPIVFGPIYGMYDMISTSRCLDYVGDATSSTAYMSPGFILAKWTGSWDASIGSNIPAICPYLTCDSEIPETVHMLLFIDKYVCSRDNSCLLPYCIENILTISF